MDSRSLIFLQVMAAIAVVAVLAYLVFLVGRSLSKSETSDSEYSPSRWYQYLLAALLLLIIASLGIWQFSTQGLLGQANDWRGDGRAITFFTIMLIVAGLGLIAFLAYLITQSLRQNRMGKVETSNNSLESASETVSALEETTMPSSFGLRMLGLMALIIAFLILNWAYLSPEAQYSAIFQLIYPGGIAVALVLLFDKASRSWNVKSGSENFREWLLCDSMTFLIILGFINLYHVDKVKEYSAMFFDVLYVALFFMIFWLIDRTRIRLRFLIAHVYYIALPILLLIWRAVQDVAVPTETSWWSSIWPFFFLSIIAFVLEIIVLLIQGKDPNSREKQGLGAIKDVIFLVSYGILLIIAIPEVAA